MSATDLKLRSPRWREVEVTLTATKVAGAMDKIEDLVGVYVDGGDSADDVTFIYACDKIVLPKTASSGIIFTKGDKVYFDNSAKKLTNVSSGNTLCGRALEDASATDTEVEIDLNGAVVA